MKASSVKPHTEILNFAEQAVQTLSEKCTSAILGRLVRVGLVVNEF